MAERYPPIEPYEHGMLDAGDGDLTAAYSRLLNHSGLAVRAKAASDWCAWEDTHVSLFPEGRHNPRYDDPEFQQAWPGSELTIIDDAVHTGSTAMSNAIVAATDRFASRR
jgi:hypothetical protein